MSVPFSGTCNCCTVECEEECAGCTSCEGDPCAASAACLAECEATRGECITACGMAYDTCYAGCGGDPGCIATCVADNEACEAACGDPCDEADCPTYTDCQDCETAAAACAACESGCPSAFGECLSCQECTTYPEDVQGVGVIVTYSFEDTCGSFECPGADCVSCADGGSSGLATWQGCESCTAEVGDYPECAGVGGAPCYQMTRVVICYGFRCTNPLTGEPGC